jgi:hypothetical protein
MANVVRPGAIVALALVALGSLAAWGRPCTVPEVDHWIFDKPWP